MNDLCFGELHYFSKMLPNGLFLVLTFISISVEVKSLTVQTENGLLSGTIYKTVEGKEVLAFLGVPYARPPLDDLRFAEPQPVVDWKGVRTAHNFSSRCIQFTYYKMHNDPIIGEEDCLYLSIFTPTLESSSKLDVIFYIHGGAFMFGSSDVFLPDFILNRHNVVFVTINYRLGPFGFLTTEDGVIPGNLGLKDQVIALKWVQNNIENFGGDKRKVTIAGLSAGGASVHLHYLSPLSRNLFQKGISVSGSAFCPWVLAENSRTKAKTLASSVGCPPDDSKRLLECLRLKSAKQLLLQLDHLFMPWYFNPFSPFGAVIERQSSSAFLTKNPYDLIKEGDVQDVPWLASVTTEEGLYPGSSFIKNNELMEELDTNWVKIAPHLLDYNQTIAPGQINHVSEKIRNFYLGDKKISEKSIKELVQIMSDRLFVVDIERAARLQASVTSSSVYFYTFGYRGKYSLGDGLCKCTDNFGSSHGDDLVYILNPAFNISPLETEDDKKMVEKMVNLWISFVKTGKPFVSSDVQWSPVSKDVSEEGNLTHVLISSSKKVEQLHSEDLGNRKFWDSIPFEELWNADIESSRYSDEL